KSTLLEAIHYEACLNVPSWLVDGRYVSTPLAWLDYMGLLMLHSLPGRHDQQVAQLKTTLSQQKSLLLIDNAESLGMTGEWLRTHFLATLHEAPLLIALAARGPLFEWQTDPLWHNRMEHWELSPLTFSDTQVYVSARGIGADQWGARLYHQTKGHPLSLALAVDAVGHDPTIVPQISQTVTARVLREVVTEKWIPVLESLALVQEADENTLEALTQQTIGSIQYHQLLSLSFISVGPLGLRMHDTVRKVLLDDLRRRNPERFIQQRRQALRVLEARRRQTDEATRLRSAAMLLELYRDDLPVEPWLNFSTVTEWREHCRVQECDRQTLHALLPDKPHTPLLEPNRQHAFLDAIITRYPEGVRVVRNHENAAIGFWVGLWISEKNYANH
ncbi:MAG: hypothetical protein OWR62_12585, partial [Sulfobacillus thermotolerans]|nr:hypothetical protein [Sulfobacillus thermotolerans]